MAKIVVVFFVLQAVALSMTAIRLPNIYQFQRLQNNLFQLAYRLEDGSLIRGESYPLAGQFRILIDENKNIHWMGATSSGPEAIEDAVKPVNRTTDGFVFKNDYDEYRLHVDADRKGHLEVQPYVTEWDFSNVCFERISRYQYPFRFRLESKNNNLKYNGTTVADTENPFRHTFDVEDGRLTGKYQVEFTRDDVYPMRTICKSVTEMSAETVDLDTRFDDNIDPSLLKSMIG